MKVVIPGGTGLLGTQRADAFVADGHEVVVVGRAASGASEGVTWDGKTLGPWANELDGADVVINLAGRTRWRSLHP